MSFGENTDLLAMFIACDRACADGRKWLSESSAFGRKSTETLDLKQQIF